MPLYQAERARIEEHLNTQLHQKDAEIQQQLAQLQEKDVQIHQREVELGQTRNQLQQKDAIEIRFEVPQVIVVVWYKSDHSPHLQSLRADLKEREARLRAQEEEMKQRDAEINRLTGELRRYQELLRQVSRHGVCVSLRPVFLIYHSYCTSSP